MPLNIPGLRETMLDIGYGGTDDPDRAARRLRRQQDGVQNRLDMLQQGATQQPQSMGQGMGAVAQALAYRRLKGQQPVAPGVQAPGLFSGATMKLFG